MLSFKIIVGTLFGLLILALVILGVISYRYNKQAVNTSFWVNHSHELIQATDEISSTLKDLQLESYVIDIEGDTSRLRDYRIARRQVIHDIKKLQSLSADDEQQPIIDSIARLVPGFISFADSAVTLSTPGVKTRNTSHRIREANRFRAQLNFFLSEIKANEIERLRSQEKENTQSIASFDGAFRQLLAGIGILVVVAFLSIRYNFNRLIKVDEQLRIGQEKTEKALQKEIELNKLKSNFVALASHEFRTPLTTVLSSASLLENYSLGENHNKMAKHIARIKSSVNSLTSILDEFLSLSRIEEDKVIPNFERLDLKQYMENCVSNLRQFAKRSQTIIYSHTGPKEAETDPVFIGNIINNLVTNSIKYSGENSTIYVSSHVNDRIHLSVRDNGIGISVEDQKHLFERFYRASNAGAVQGTGLGLYIMKHYVDVLNGSVNIQSDIGKGTHVEVTLAASPHPLVVKSTTDKNQLTD